MSLKSLSVCLEYYELYPCHCFSSPGLSWDPILKVTSGELEHWFHWFQIIQTLKFQSISDIDMYLFVEKGMRDGFYYIAKRYSEANNKYIKLFGNCKPSK